ncbi:hypothetical protein [Tichowtungia aerotolerans]|uniref:Uncharacterized protein n=1 Tax=Tichowtungia aerotolerans TaxID=2697043 RepID=A0A6P1MBZ3_9BACT|nr:hypothetical protein [Tichowtungia aerotolerans]QHI70623.1 hypothetical protein GT409_14635 [Tichowtungia aerotolerans]
MKHILLIATLCAAAHCLGDKPLDFWDEEIRLFNTARPARPLDVMLSAHRAAEFKPRGFSLDHADHKVGDLSIAYSPAKAGMPKRFGFFAGLWNEKWTLSPEASLTMWIKAENTDFSAPWRITLVDFQNLEAVGELNGITGDWQELTLPLSELKAANGFDWTQVKLCEFDAKLDKEALVHFDGIRFKNDKDVTGVTDKTVVQRMAEAEISRTLRMETALKTAADNENGGLYAPVAAFAKMMLNEDLETANQILTDELKQSSEANVWSLLHTPLYCRFYYMFSNRCGKFPGRMTPETEKLLLKTLWSRTSSKNDIHWARQSTWYLDGSENHDLNAKACNLVTSHIFMNEPDYKDRIYPDYGFGGSYHYGHAGYYGPGVDEKTRHHGGRANLSDEKKHNAADHYEAWLAYFKTYFRERAERGFFLEYGSYGYSKHTLNMFDLAQHYCGDDGLRSMLDNFLTLYWAEWAQVSISGVRGGPKTRHHSKVGGPDDKATADLIGFHLGGPGNAGPWWYWNIVNDYRLPSIVWKMALDREGMGCFTYKARGIGEEVNEMPRPLGTERSLVVDTEARMLKNTYVTPDYTLGTQMDHPLTAHSHLSICGRWHGMTFAQNPHCRIVPVGITDGPNEKGKKSPYDLEVMYHTAQHERTLIVQQSRRWYAIHPDWYPNSIEYNQPVGIWFGNEWDKRIEKDGWIFVQSGDAYAAVRPVLWDEAYEKENKKKTTGNQVFFNAPDDAPTVKLRTDCHKWNENKTMLIYEDNYTATIIEAGRRIDYPTLEEFMADVLDNPIALYKTVVPGDNILVYTPCGKDAKEMVFNCGTVQIPTIGNEPVNYSYPMTFDSPTLKSKYKSGKIRIEFGGETLDLDFSRKPWWNFWK